MTDRLRIEIYQTIIERKEVVKVRPENLQAIANWTGGTVKDIQSPEETASVTLMIPTLSGALTANIGDLVVKDYDTGRFEIYDESRFLKHYKPVGIRQNGINR